MAQREKVHRSGLRNAERLDKEETGTRIWKDEVGDKNSEVQGERHTDVKGRQTTKRGVSCLISETEQQKQQWRKKGTKPKR